MTDIICFFIVLENLPKKDWPRWIPHGIPTSLRGPRVLSVVGPIKTVINYIRGVDTLSHVGKMRVEMINYTPNPDRTCAVSAQSCRSKTPAYELLDKVTDSQITKTLRTAIQKGHHSILEHASFTFSVSGVSRALTHQLVRHRIASYSQQSQRYVRIEKPLFVTPPSVSRDKKTNLRYSQFMTRAWRFYSFLLEEGIPEEDSRFVLPNATSTNIVITMNARELLHFFELRCCIKAQWEIRRLAHLMLGKVRMVAPVIFEKAGPPCSSCREGLKDCRLYRAKNHFGRTLTRKVQESSLRGCES